MTNDVSTQEQSDETIKQTPENTTNNTNQGNIEQNQKTESQEQKGKSCSKTIFSILGWIFFIIGPVLLYNHVGVMPLPNYSSILEIAAILLTIIEIIIILLRKKKTIKEEIHYADNIPSIISIIIVSILFIIPNIYCLNHIIIRLLNSYLDFSKPTARYVKVEEVIRYQEVTSNHNHTVKLGSYTNYRVSSWLPDTKTVEIPALLATLKKGDVCKLETKPGLFGMEFVSDITKDNFPPAEGNYPMTEEEHDRLAPMKEVNLGKYHKFIIKNKNIKMPSPVKNPKQDGSVTNSK